MPGDSVLRSPHSFLRTRGVTISALRCSHTPTRLVASDFVTGGGDTARQQSLSIPLLITFEQIWWTFRSMDMDPRNIVHLSVIIIDQIFTTG